MTKRNGNPLLIVCLVMVSFFSFAEPPTSTDVSFQFELRYKEWKTFVQKYGDILSDSTGTSIKLFSDIVKLGPKGLPFIMEKMKVDPILVIAVIYITKRYFPVGVWRREMRHEELANLYLKWWYEWKDKTLPEDFLRFYDTYKSPKTIGEDKKKKAIEGIRRLGIGVLPLLIEKIEVWDDDLKEVVKWLTNNEFPAALGSTKPLDWWKENCGKYVLPFPPD